MKDNVGIVIAVILVFGFGYGWIANIVKLFSLHGLTGEMVLRIIGIPLAPLGALLGYL